MIQTLKSFGYGVLGAFDFTGSLIQDHLKNKKKPFSGNITIHIINNKKNTLVGLVYCIFYGMPRSKSFPMDKVKSQLALMDFIGQLEKDPSGKYTQIFIEQILRQHLKLQYCNMIIQSHEQSSSSEVSQQIDFSESDSDYPPKKTQMLFTPFNTLQ